MTRRVGVGLAVAAVYVAVTFLVPGTPSRPLFDAIGPPQPYRWLKPPPEFAPTNQPPQPASHELRLGPNGSDAASIATPDGQAAIVLKETSFVPREGENVVLIGIEPVDPAGFGAPPKKPTELRYDGNAYRFTASYKRSGAEATLSQPATVVLTFPIVATTLLRRDGDLWTDLKANPVSVQLQIFATTPALGVFVAAGPPLEDQDGGGNFPTALVISLGAAAAAVVAGLVARTRARKRRRARAKSKAAKSKAPPKRR